MKNIDTNNTFDIFIIGGGINGAGIARDAAGRGLSVALCEMNDFASGTSSASTKLIHGGLRYLEHYEFRLVKEALIEREILLKLAPHIIWPRRFVLPHMPGMRPAWMIRLGLFLYDYLNGNRRLPASKSIRLSVASEGKCLQEKLSQAFVYSDCCVDDARLVILNLISAAELGATVLRSTQYLSATRVDNGWEINTKNLMTGELQLFRSKAIVNAAGPWIKHVLQTSSLPTRSSDICLVKGSHIVVRRKYQGEHAYIFQNQDSRIIFAIPYENNFTLIGTTDVPMSDQPDAVKISEQEIDYLCKSASLYFKDVVKIDDIVWTYSGVRPLFDDGSGNPSKVTRDYAFEINDEKGHSPFLTILGGKLTTYRKLAENALDKLGPYFLDLKPTWTATSCLPGGDLATDSFQEFVNSLYVEFSFLPQNIVSSMARRYGALIYKILMGVKSIKDLGQNFGDEMTELEVNYLLKEEWARSLEDILWRRTKCGLTMTQQHQKDLEEYIFKATRA